MSFEQSKWVWMNGECIRWSDARIHVSAHALHYGTGVFEGIRCYKTVDGPALFRLDDHLTRLFLSAEVHGIELPYSPDEIEEAVCTTVGLNEFESCYIRPICYYGGGGLGLHPRDCPVEVAILAWPWAALLGDESLVSGVRVTVSPWIKFSSRTLPTTAKACGQYLNSILAVRDAYNRGFDEALLRDERGNIAEGSGENLFIVSDGRLITNDAASSILLGVTRDTVIEVARNLGYEVEIATISVERLLDADEAFLTGTAAEVAPICELDGRRIGAGRRGPITERLQRAFFDITTGRDRSYSRWLHPVHYSVASDMSSRRLSLAGD